MLSNWKVIADMTRLVMEHPILRAECSIQGVLAWCTWAVNTGHVEYVYDGEEMIGFMDWIRADDIPQSRADYQRLLDTGKYDTGDICIVANCCVVRGKDTLRKLISTGRSKNELCQLMCWHDRKADRMRYFCWHPHLAKKEELCRETAVC